MPEQDWSPEPWSMGEDEIIPDILDANGSHVVVDFDKMWPDRTWVADLRRIVACVNACRGIPTEWLSDANNRLLFTLDENIPCR